MKKIVIAILLLATTVYAQEEKTSPTAALAKTTQPQKKHPHTKRLTIINDTEFIITINGTNKANTFFEDTIDPKKSLEKKWIIEDPTTDSPTVYTIESIRNPKTDSFLKINKSITLKDAEQKQDKLQIKISGVDMVDITITTVPASKNPVPEKIPSK